MDNYHCEACNRNIAISSSIKLICQECGYYLVNGKLSQREIEQRQIIRRGYCRKCEKSVLSVPPQFVIEHFLQQKEDKLRDFEYKMPRSSCLCFILITVLIPFLAALVVITYGLLAIPLIVVGYLYFRYQKQNTIRQISYDTQKKINQLKERQIEFEFICPYCANGVSVSYVSP